MCLAYVSTKAMPILTLNGITYTKYETQRNKADQAIYPNHTSGTVLLYNEVNWHSFHWVFFLLEILF
jgi:hypothetical protein